MAERFNPKRDQNDGGRGGDIGICSEPKVTSLLGSPSLNDFTCDQIHRLSYGTGPQCAVLHWGKNKGLVGCHE